MVYQLESFDASISSQGVDRHIHIPKRFHKKLVEDGLMNKTFRVTIVLEDIVENTISV